MFKRRTLAHLMAAAALAPVSAGAQGRLPLSRIAFGSCADQVKPQPIWDAILAYRPELFIFAGDNVYGDFPHKAVAKELFLKFWKVPADDIRRTRDGIYDSRIIGPPGMRMQIILLDLRWFRSPLKASDQRGTPGKERYVPDPDPAKTMLGPVQWAWLAGELRKPAELRLIVSSTQVLAEGHGWERWGNLPLERQKLLDTIRDSGAKGCVLLSGDRHVGALYRETPPGLYPIYEVTSSGLNMVFWEAREPGPNRLGALYAAANFGVVDIDWPEHKITLALRGVDGNTQRSALLSLDELGLAH